jgi:hypothetical protein
VHGTASVIVPAAVKVKYAKSNNSAVLLGLSVVTLPAISTFPFGNRVAVWNARGSCIAAVGVKAPVAGSQQRGSTKHKHAVRPKTHLVRPNRIGRTSRAPKSKSCEARELAAKYSRCILFPFWYRFRQRLGGVAVVRLISKSIALLCLLLAFWSAIEFAAHHHSNAAESAKCAVCIAAHSASPKATTNLPRVMFVSVSLVRPEPVSAKQCPAVLVLSVRPPPSI